jgi:hydroxymethylpyrimidine pyrophosphatase-like HAD family hydrolase
MEKYNLEFCFKGSRNYVHGTDIFNNLLGFLSKFEIQNKNIDVSFHGIAKKNIELLRQKPEDESIIKFACKFLDKDDTRKVFYGVENNIEITCRHHYQEEEIYGLAKVNLDKKSIILSEHTSFTFIENIVALNKYLLETLFPDVNGKWYFTRLQIKHVPDNDIYPLKLILKANFNFKLIKTEISIEDELIGFIYFSLV